MEFTIKAYVALLELLMFKGYNFCSYQESDIYEKCVILRHDVDFTLDKALQMAIIENSLGIKSTYFILLSTDFYNVFSKQSFKKLQQIMQLGHEIGLHFDEKRYNIKTINDMEKHIENELNIISDLLNYQVNVISMHRPSDLVLENDIQFKNIINSYSFKFFKSMKYISDSRMNWREDPIEIIKSDNYQKLHILTHPFWYSATNETMEYKLREFLNKAISERYEFMDDNFTALNQVIGWKEIIQ